MRRSKLSWLVAVLLAVAACRKTAGEAPRASDPPAIRVEGSQVLVDGHVAGTTIALEELGRLQRIDELFTRLKERREAAKAESPGQPLSGRAAISMPPETPLLVFKSVFQTAAFAGYPELVVETAPHAVVVDAIVPGPPEQRMAPRVELHLYLEDTRLRLVEKRGAAEAREQSVDAPPDAPDLDQRVQRLVVQHVLRSDLRANPVVGVIVHGENRLPFKKLAAVLRGLRAAQERLAGPDGGDGAFDLRLAVN
jgi:hypothetical protein